MSKTPELLPCPFCGSEAVEIMTASDEEICHDTQQAVCRYCGAVGGIDHVGQGEEEAATMWNRRAQPKPEPLTLRQLQAEWRNGSPVYAQNMDNTKINRRSGVWCVMLVHGRRINK